MRLISNKKPIRKCIACSKRGTKDEFLMMVRPPKTADEKSVEVCEGVSKKAGRGYYICKDLECIKRAKKTHRIERMISKGFVCDAEAIYSRLEKAVRENE